VLILKNYFVGISLKNACVEIFVSMSVFFCFVSHILLQCLDIEGCHYTSTVVE
jgi:hypothetical protein